VDPAAGTAACSVCVSERPHRSTIVLAQARRSGACAEGGRGDALPGRGRRGTRRVCVRQGQPELRLCWQGCRLARPARSRNRPPSHACSGRLRPGAGKPAMELDTRIELVENHKTFAAFGFVKTAERSHAGYTRATFITMQKALVP